GHTLLTYSCEQGQAHHVKFLMENGVDINKTDSTGYTPLTMACIKGHKGYEKMAIFLIERGADINKEDENGDTPIMMACYHGCESVVQLLVKKGIDINEK
ncbi:hypothetical protein PIROE2DRAFT_28582, partial [Piromyces sp. E2]